MKHDIYEEHDQHGEKYDGFTGANMKANTQLEHKRFVYVPYLNCQS